MRGLIVKDFLLLRKSLKFYAVFFVAYTALGLLGAFDATFIAAFLQLMTAMLPISAFSYDEVARWDRYAVCLPVGRDRVVQARYLFTLLMLGCSVTLASLAGLLLSALSDSSLTETLLTVLGSSCYALLMPSLVLPLCFRRGPEQARTVMMVIFFLPALLLILLVRTDTLGKGILTGLGSLTTSQIALFLSGILVLFLLLLGLSCLISCRAYRRREF